VCDGVHHLKWEFGEGVQGSSQDRAKIRNQGESLKAQLFFDLLLFLFLPSKRDMCGGVNLSLDMGSKVPHSHKKKQRLGTQTTQIKTTLFNPFLFFFLASEIGHV
jgi:hypothetical protein